MSSRANIEEVETEVVEIEAKLEKVTEGTAELLCIQTQTKPGFTRNQKVPVAKVAPANHKRSGILKRNRLHAEMINFAD